ncbi:hypothetical protein AMIS_25360 [Actinoplanes missouriensis 431]|uniref:Uncharacterized protein n=1 Tax=Actinoplanes missouriensis (strain ATCC 14538 / DSM 43046 / CBS 188.64 / JCM 3121 / NBRC 102363 / NCIMB 12654 / NRRL B-3342 / UNCC 431) TaxID=512565 RepID=I0H419_ACTM4|nr:hypothetical protein [Actinoplanes missouriensis]BAL87756.1 hypothetical protein AMIS_25360 [Actinoplanes missouriensis 431]
MTAGSVRRPGRYWIFTAVVMPLNPVVWYLIHRWQACIATHPGAEQQKYDGPCGTEYGLFGLAGLALLPLLSTIAVALFVGIMEGRRRYRFAAGRWISAVVVGVCSPPTLLVYALGYGIGRALPVPQIMKAHQLGWESAVNAYTALSRGLPPQQVLAGGFVSPEPVYLDTVMGYARYYGMNVTFQPGFTVAVGSPGFVAGAAIGNLVSNSLARSRAAAMAQTQWREHRTVRVIVTASTTWCCIDGRWLRFDHAAVMEYYLENASCVMTFPGTEPLMLTGPPAALHAVLFAYLRGGPTWQYQPFLHPIAASAPMVA